MKPNDFWTWFQDNQQKLYVLPLLSSEEQEEYRYWLQTYLNYYGNGISFELKFCKTYTTPATLILFTNDDPVTKMLVLTLIEEAPLMDNWHVVSFNKRKEDLTTNQKDVPVNFKLNINQLYFQPVFKKNGANKISINIYISKSVSYLKRAQFKRLCVETLNEMVGDESLEAHVSVIRCNFKAQIPGVVIKLIYFHQFIKSLTNH